VVMRSSHSPSTSPLSSASPHLLLSTHQPQKGSLLHVLQDVYPAQFALRHDWKNHSVQFVATPPGPRLLPGRHSSVLSHHPHPFRVEHFSQEFAVQDWANDCERNVANRIRSHMGLILFKTGQGNPSH
jgi:hypothetical protein